MLLFLVVGEGLPLFGKLLRQGRGLPELATLLVKLACVDLWILNGDDSNIAGLCELNQSPIVATLSMNSIRLFARKLPPSR